MRPGHVLRLVAAFATMALLGGFSAFVRPSFALMFMDFGGELPGLTQWVMRWWFAPLLSLPTLGLVAGSFAVRLPPARHAMVALALLLGVIALIVCFVAMYLPIFSIAGAIKE